MMMGKRYLDDIRDPDEQHEGDDRNYLIGRHTEAECINHGREESLDRAPIRFRSYQAFPYRPLSVAQKVEFLVRLSPALLPQELILTPYWSVIVGDRGSAWFKNGCSYTLDEALRRGLLRSARSAMGHTQEEAAKILRVPVAQLRAWESCGSPPRCYAGRVLRYILSIRTLA